MNALRPRWRSTGSIPVGSIIVPPLRWRIAGSLTETKPSLMPSLPLAKCPKVGAPPRPPVSNDIALGPYISEPGTSLEDSDSARRGRDRITCPHPVYGWRPLCTRVRFGHSRGEERHEHESNHPAPSGSLLVAPWTSLLLGNLMYPSLSWAWGDLGHKIICRIAFEELNDKARNEVIRS